MDNLSTEEKMKRSEAFQQLQPLCINLVKSPSIQGLDSLKAILKDTDKTILKELHEYIIFPLRLIIKQKIMNEKIVIRVCQCMTTILSCTTITKYDTFQDMFVSYTLMLSSPENPSNLGSIHEELKVAIVEVLNILVKNTDYSLALNQLYTAKNLPILGHTVSLLLYLIQDEKLKNLRILAMDCLVALSHSENTCIQVKVTSSSIFASFLPRISTVLCSVITGDSTQGHLVTKKAIETWQKLLLLVMSDELLTKCLTIEAKLKNDAGNKKLEDLIMTRDPDWIKNTSDKLVILVRQVGNIKQHSSWRVRLSLLDWAHMLLINCKKSMSSSQPVLLEVLVILSCDTYPNISSKSEKALKEFQEQCQKNQSRPLMEILEENLLSMATTLPRQFRTSDDSQKLCLIRIISGYLKILGSNMNCLLHSYSHLKRFSLALIQVLELDCSSVKIVEEQTQILGHGTSAIKPQGRVNVHQPRKNFRHFHDESIYQELISLLQLIGHYGDLNLLVDHFLGLFYETSLNRLQATLILNQIMLGTIQKPDGLEEEENVKGCDKKELICIISSLIEEYLSPNNFNLLTSHVAKEAIPVEGQFSLVLYNRTQPTFYDYNANILQICLFLEGFANFAKVLQKDFHPFFIKVLYPMLEKLGDCSAYLSNTAYLALNSICDSCGYKNIEELIQQNIDYLVNAITLRLRHLPQNPHAPIVLKVILQFGNHQLLPLIQNTITNILECLDDYQTIHVTIFMQVLHELCCAVRQWFPENKESIENNSAMTCVEEEENKDNTKWLVDFLSEYHKNKKIAAGEFDDEETKTEEEMDWTPASQNENMDEDKEEEEKPPPPQHVTIIIDVISRVKHLLSSEDVHLKLIVLDTITAAIYSLQPHEDHLLPMVHQLWTPFTQRFSDREIVVRIKAFQILVNVSEVCGSFIRKRTTKEVFPKLCNFLKSQSKLSSNCGSGYSFTQAYKMQHTILDSLGNLCTNLGIEGKEVDGIATACIPYLSVHEHPELKKAALKTFESLIEIEPDGMWLKLSSVYNQNIYTPPAPMFKKVEFNSKKGEEYSNSIEVLFKNPLLQCKSYQVNVD